MFNQEMKFLSLSMMKDTDRRYKETPDVLSFPEPEEVMLPYTKQVISGTANKVTSLLVCRTWSMKVLFSDRLILSVFDILFT